MQVRLRNMQRRVRRLFPWILAALFFLPGMDAAAAPFRVGVLMLGDVRAEPVSGLKDGLAALGYVDGKDVIYEVRNGGGERSRLAALADEIVKSRPAVAVAGGGVEADALKAASDGSGVPVVFLAVASAVDRGLVASMKRSGNNLTGVDTNDTELTAKRLWFIRKMFPEARRILIPSIPNIAAAVKTVAVARAEAPALGLEIRVLEGRTVEEVSAGLSTLSAGEVDVIYIGMAAPVWQVEKTIFYPWAVSHKIPIMGVNRGDINRGALSSYAGSRYESGKQAARLVQKILGGTLPTDIPVETPLRVEFIINRWVADRLGIKLPHRVWQMADEVVSIPME